MTVDSFMESNAKKKKAKESMDPELKKQKLEEKEKYECFKKLVDSEAWKECLDVLEKDVYNALSFAPGDGGDWWARYAYGLKACIERIKAHAKKYEDAIEFLSKQ